MKCERILFVGQAFSDHKIFCIVQVAEASSELHRTSCWHTFCIFSLVFSCLVLLVVFVVVALLSLNVEVEWCECISVQSHCVRFFFSSYPSHSLEVSMNHALAQWNKTETEKDLLVFRFIIPFQSLK